MRSTQDANKILADAPVNEIRDNLLRWWLHKKRHFPWRDTRDPYSVLVAEILLHRTRADQVVPLYHQFLQRFPDIHALARSTPEELQYLFRSGGLHWRWKLLHTMAAELEVRFRGQIPQEFDDLISLPGVSHYIASAVRCFAFSHPDVILDTNTVRVTGRLLGLPVTDSSRRSSLFRSILEKLLDKKHPCEFNFALIDFAALICRSRNPQHDECCVNRYCNYYKKLFVFECNELKSKETLI